MVPVVVTSQPIVAGLMKPPSNPRLLIVAMAIAAPSDPDRYAVGIVQNSGKVEKIPAAATQSSVNDSPMLAEA